MMNKRRVALRLGMLIIIILHAAIFLFGVYGGVAFMFSPGILQNIYAATLYIPALLFIFTIPFLLLLREFARKSMLIISSLFLVAFIIFSIQLGSEKGLSTILMGILQFSLIPLATICLLTRPKVKEQFR